jgi:hypothetical protein
MRFHSFCATSIAATGSGWYRAKCRDRASASAIAGLRALRRLRKALQRGVAAPLTQIGINLLTSATLSY